MKNSNIKSGLLNLIMSLMIISLCFPLVYPCSAAGMDKEVLAKDLSTFFRAARKVISVNQSLINDAAKGDKGLNGDSVVSAAKANYKDATKTDFPNPDETVAGKCRLAMLDAIRDVMDQAQELINEKGKGFKGFLPAVFAAKVAEGFSNRMAGVAYIKLTAPKDYVRNRKNRPDKWEHEVIESKFKQSDWKKGQSFSEVGTHKGKAGFRFILPEYYGQSCLKCHGEPKGERDITGGKKEGGKLGELGGGISVVIYN